MRARAGLVTVLAAGALLLSACGPTIGGAGAIDTPTTTAATTSDATTATPLHSATEAPSPAPPATPAPAYVMTGGSTGDLVR